MTIPPRRSRSPIRASRQTDEKLARARAIVAAFAANPGVAGARAVTVPAIMTDDCRRRAG